MDATTAFEAESDLRKAISNKQNLVKESRWLTKFPLAKDHTGHAVGEVRLLISPLI